MKRHLLPNEFDLLLDRESGFGVQPLREHVRGCAECRDRLEEKQSIVAAIDQLPLMSPRIGMADRVMARVPVFVPWHVAARDALSRLVPEAPGMRAAAAAVVAIVGSALTALVIWIASRGDLLGIVSAVAGEGVRVTVSQAIGDVVIALFGRQLAVAVDQVGPLGAALAFAGFLLAVGATVIGLRRIAAASAARS